MTPDEVIAKLDKTGIKTSRSTLLRFENQGLIPIPVRGSDGRGKGRYSEFPEDTPYEYIASHILLSKPYRFKPVEVATARAFALKAINNQCNSVTLSREIDKIREALYDPKKPPIAWLFWWTIKIFAENSLSMTKVNGVVSPTILAPWGINKTYDSIVDKAIKRLETCTDLFLEELCNIVLIRGIKLTYIERVKKEVEEHEIILDKINKLRAWDKELNGLEKKYLYRAIGIYKRRESIRKSIEKKLKEKFPYNADLIIELLQRDTSKELKELDDILKERTTEKRGLQQNLDIFNLFGRGKFS